MKTPKTTTFSFDHWQIDLIPAKGYKPSQPLYYSEFTSPFGKGICVVSDTALIGFGIYDDASKCADALSDISKQFGTTPKQNSAATKNYIDAILKNSTKKNNIHLFGTPFQLQVWKALLAIPKGKMCTYQDIAKKIKSPKAMRAVGSAVGQNPIGYLIPCHRVIRTDGTLGGYSGGLDVKRKMLAYEGLPQFLK
jgi:AraC family transcriptional regulator of adaptative response/methylated-DNA-[protein]-cysteine methyltransferase